MVDPGGGNGGGAGRDDAMTRTPGLCARAPLGADCARRHASGMDHSFFFFPFFSLDLDSLSSFRFFSFMGSLRLIDKMTITA
jgi:hypothetical protein